MSHSKTSITTTLIETGALLAVVSLAGMYYLLVPRLTTANADYAQNSAQHEALQKDIRTLTSAGNALSQLESQHSDQFVAGKAAVPATEDMPSLYIQLENITGATPGLTNVSYQAGTPTVVDQGVQVPVSVTASGKYIDLKNLLNRLERNSRPISFSNLVFTQGVSASSAAVNDPASQTGLLTVVATGYARANALSSAYSDPGGIK